MARGRKYQRRDAADDRVRRSESVRGVSMQCDSIAGPDGTPRNMTFCVRKIMPRLHHVPVPSHGSIDALTSKHFKTTLTTSMFTSIPSTSSSSSARLALAMWASWRVKGAYARYSQVPASSGLSGAQIAQRILDLNNIRDVVVVSPHPGLLSDHYDPAEQAPRAVRRKLLRHQRRRARRIGA
jgi:hypothetical protein